MREVRAERGREEARGGAASLSSKIFFCVCASRLPKMRGVGEKNEEVVVARSVPLVSVIFL